MAKRILTEVDFTSASILTFNLIPLEETPLVEMTQTIISHPYMKGEMKAVGIIVIDATGDFSWVAPSTRIDDAFCDELVRRGISIKDLVTREPRDDERITATFIRVS